MFLEKCTKYSRSPKNTQTIDQKRVTFYNFWNRSSHRNDCFSFLELCSIIYQAHYIRTSVRNVFIRMCLFQNSLMTTAHFRIWYLICVFSIFIGGSVIFVEIQTDIITIFKILDIGMSGHSHY